MWFWVIYCFMNLRWSQQFLVFGFDWHLLIVNINEASAVFQRLVKFRLPDSHLNPFPMSFSISHNQYSLVRFNFSSLHMMRVNLGDLVSKSGLFNLTSSSSVYLLRMTDFILFGWIAEASSVIKQRGNMAVSSSTGRGFTRPELKSQLSCWLDKWYQWNH